MMRLALVCMLVVGCSTNGPASRCQEDAQCADSETCARSGECVAADEIAAPITFTWMMNGQVASEASCASHPALQLVFISVDDSADLVLHEIPCVAGMGFVVDRLPSRLLNDAELGIEGAARTYSFPAVNWDERSLSGGERSVDFDLRY